MDTTRRYKTASITIFSRPHDELYGDGELKPGGNGLRADPRKHTRTGLKPPPFPIHTNDHFTTRHEINDPDSMNQITTNSGAGEILFLSQKAITTTRAEPPETFPDASESAYTRSNPDGSAP